MQTCAEGRKGDGLMGRWAMSLPRGLLSGLAMGHAALWLARVVPVMVESVSSFVLSCPLHSPLPSLSPITLTHHPHPSPSPSPSSRLWTARNRGKTFPSG
jgi:hypothetical protein